MTAEALPADGDGGRDARRAPVDRTSLSWQRTALQASLVALFAALTALRLGEPSVGVIAAVLAAAALVTIVLVVAVALEL